MKAYVGDTRSKKLLAKLRAHDIGQIIIRGKLRGRRLNSWAYDNGAFVDWREGRPFDGDAFLRDLRELQSEPCKPEFIVLPDKVADPESASFSRVWLSALRAKGLDRIAPLYFAVQNGQTAGDVPWSSVAGVFIGGTDEWKRSTAAYWTREAHARGAACHYARCGTAKKVSQAVALGCDSLDSCLPLWSRENCARFLGALAQQPMFPGMG